MALTRDARLPFDSGGGGARSGARRDRCMSSYRRRVLAATLASLAVALFSAPAPQAQSGSRTDLYARIRSTRAQKNVAIAQAADCRAELRKSEARLAQAQKQLRASEQRLIETRQAITDAERAVFKAEKALARQIEVSGLRLRAMHKAGDVGFVEVLVGANDFTELQSRSYIFGQLARSDAAIAAAIEEKRRAAEGLRLDLDKKRGRVEEERRQIQACKGRIAEETERVRVLTAQKQAQADALAAEEAQLESASRALEARIRAATSGGRGYRGTYSGSLSSASVGSGGGGGGGGGGPVRGILTSAYGPRGGRMHRGVDIAAPTGTSVGSSGSGRVISAGWQDGYGNVVVVDHGGGRSTVYAHLSRIDVRDGDAISSGQRVGAVGSTGRSTGPHLHYEVRVNGQAVNPMGH